MSGKQPSYNNLVQLLIFLVFTTSIPSIVFAKANKEVIPKNAHAQTYSNEWKCDLEFQAHDKICVAIKIPENAY